MIPHRKRPLGNVRNQPEQAPTNAIGGYCNPAKARTVKSAEILTSMAKEKFVRHVRLNNGQIKCPYCRIELVMDAVVATIFLERQCPSCTKSFMIVNQGTEEETRSFTRSTARSRPFFEP